MAPAGHRWALIALALALPGCGIGGDEDDSNASSRSETSTTRVEVVEGLGEDGNFDPAALYDSLAPGVVTVVSIFEGQTLIDPGGEGGQGSGFVLDGEGFIATNAHVVTTGGAGSRSRAEQVFVELADGDRVPAEIVGDDPFADVALLKIDPAGLDLTPLELGSIEDVRVGAPVAAIGSPFGERQSLSIGVISAVDRNIESLTQFQIGNAIQTDAAINPGNSGGPLLSAEGKVLGINAQIRSRSGGGEGVGFAIPADVVERSLRELREKGEVDYGYLGVTTQTLYPQLADELGVEAEDGALVVEVVDGSPADQAGLGTGEETIEFQGQDQIPAEGDVVVSVDGEELTRTRDLADAISAKSAGDRVTLEVVRGGERREVEVELGERPEQAPLDE